MKKKLLFIIVSILFVLNSMAQADLNIYKGTDNVLSYDFDNFGTTHADSTGGPVTPYEGTTQYVFAYNSTGQSWGGQIFFNIDSWSTKIINLTQYSHLVIAWRGVATIANNTLSMTLLDTLLHETAPLVIAGNSNTTTYQLSVIPLANINFTTSSVNKSKIKYLDFKMSQANAIGVWYLDDIYFTNNPPSGINEMNSSNNLNIGPNPSSGIFTINSTDRINSVIVYDYLGNIILNNSLNASSYNINLSNQPNGIYFVTIKSNEKMTVQKLIKK